MNDENWRVLAEETLVERPPWLRMTEQSVQLPDGRIIDDFTYIHAPAYASVFGVRPDGLIVAVEEYKHGPGRVVVKMPSGFVEPGEEPLAAAKRELLEEAGYVADEWHFLGAFHDDGNRGMSQGYHYFASGLRQAAEPDANDLSVVRPMLLTPAELRQAVLQGRVGESGAAVSILLGLDALENNRHSTADKK
ncbi:MAG: NUDIX hydrolase [Caldilineales bacterium]|nr:NUDIX hydrolase [Caldilineales bacterium]